MSPTDSFETHIVPEAECFDVRLAGDGVQTTPEHGLGGQYPLLARLHGCVDYDPRNPPAQQVGAVFDLAQVLGSAERVQELSTPAQRLQAVVQEILEVAASSHVTARIIESTDEHCRVELRDARAVALEGCVDISEAVAAAGMPMRMRLLRSGVVTTEAIPRPGERFQPLACLSAQANAGSDEERVRAAVAALGEAYPQLQRTFFSLADFLDKTDSATPHEFGRNLYKYTDCGPWTSFVVPGHESRGQVYYESPQARAIAGQAPWWSQCTGVLIGSIVEGSDAEVQPELLRWPFTQDDLDRAVRNIDEEADRLWHEANDESDEDGSDEDTSGARRIDDTPRPG